MEEYKSFKLKKFEIVENVKSTYTLSQAVKIDEYNTFSRDLIKGLILGVYILNCSMKISLFSIVFYDKNNKEIKDNIIFDNLEVPSLVKDLIKINVDYNQEKFTGSSSVINYIDDEREDTKYWYLLDLSREKYLLLNFKNFEIIRGIVTIFAMVNKDIMLLSPTLPFSVNNNIKIYYEFENKIRKYVNSFHNKYIESIPFERNSNYCIEKAKQVKL